MAVETEDKDGVRKTQSRKGKRAEKVNHVKEEVDEKKEGGSKQCPSSLPSPPEERDLKVISEADETSSADDSQKTKQSSHDDDAVVVPVESAKSEKCVEKAEKKKPAAKPRRNKGSTKPSRRSAEEMTPKITDYFPVRRSTRKPESEIKKEQQSDLVAAILAECDDGLKMVECPVKGRGIVATRAFAKGAFVVEYRGELIDRSTANQRELAYAADADVGCYVYHFVFNGRPCCVDATAESAYLGRLVNHSARRPNLVTKVVDVNGSPRLVLVAKRALAAGDELLYDYGDRSPEAVAANPWLKNS